MKILIIRFSSIGDVLQTLSVVDRVREEFPRAEIHVATQSRFILFFENHPGVSQVWSVPQKSGVSEVWKLTRRLAQEKFTHVYDSHNNLRSRLLVWMLRVRLGRFKFIRRPVYRFKRFLLFRFRRNLFPQPFSGQLDQLRPLAAWGIVPRLPKNASLFLTPEVIAKVRERLVSLSLQNFVALAPSAAYPLKRWPLKSWEKLIEISPEKKFVLLGGPEDSFLNEISGRFPSRVINLAGQLSLMESAAVVALSEVLISNDTGVMHMAEQLNHPCVALMGPAPFGYPSKPSTQVLERNLSCRPCSKHGQGPCVNKDYQACLQGISPQEVKSKMESFR